MIDALPASLIAARHPPEYRLHKYWARKPHNVAAAFLRALVPPGGSVLDPFCGSGVILAEARALGLEATGIDLNPVAALIADVTANPPDPTAFGVALEAFMAGARAALAPLYRLPDGAEVRYTVHSSVTICPGCAAYVRAGEAQRAGRGRRCPACGARLRFNLHTLSGTKIVAVTLMDGTRRSDPAILAHQQAAADREGTLHLTGGFPANPRILAWESMSTADLFTPRNAGAVAALRALIAACAAPGSPEGRALLALLTAALAGCSRLIAWRDGLRGGGPAWSVPGFWVAPLHVEHNPLPLLESWVWRYRRGIARLWERTRAGPPAVVLRGAAQDLLPALAARDRCFDLIFFDPPYGDSVPYLEFSALWNAFLGEAVDYDREIAVSNRATPPAGWDAYAAGLREVAARSVDLLQPDGAILVTFNNLDGRAWAALLAALHGAGLRCEAAHYVAPAVISAKAQFAPDGSYHGDFWCIFRRGPLPVVPAARWPSLIAAAIPAEVGDPLRRRRLALRAILVHNLPAEAVLVLGQEI
ncbi:MAG: hypothetical protein HPY64_09065 [Anaerolineae bacterium]|nr:hypothetical protein [Anaerolineae bacterium]